ncbi:hypothetical protein AAG570_006103 [Ranatra chinensis]|uniref:Uncharacterized protein n=1 Tax=Ranatra chinensis TaxID=642074 RepID=A0ABD0YC38_9HEMI
MLCENKKQVTTKISTCNLPSLRDCMSFRPSDFSLFKKSAFYAVKKDQERFLQRHRLCGRDGRPLPARDQSGNLYNGSLQRISVNSLKGKASVTLTRMQNCDDSGTNEIIIWSNRINKVNRTSYTYSTNFTNEIPLNDDVKVMYALNI